MASGRGATDALRHLQCTGQPQQQRILPPVSAVLRLMINCVTKSLRPHEKGLEIETITLTLSPC